MPPEAAAANRSLPIDRMKPQQQFGTGTFWIHLVVSLGVEFGHSFVGWKLGLSSGTRLGPYEIVSPLGAGGMGEVYRARDTRLDRTVAIKVLPSHLSDNPDVKQRFEREARTISALNHPHICTLHDIGHDSGFDYLVLELVEGESLAQRIAKGRLPVKEVLQVGAEIADALDKAHRAGIVHRDLKPGNIMLTKSGAKLLDFGLAKPQAGLLATSAIHGAMTQSSPAVPASPITERGTLVGTFQYMSPEQVEGREADARSDIFALGAVLYEMTTGKRAFDGKSQISVASAILEKEPEPISVVQPMSPAGLDHVVRTCLAKDPERRYQTAHDLALELKWISESGSQAGATVAMARRRRGRRYLPWATAALLLIAGGAAGYFARTSKPAPMIQSSLQLPSGQTLQTTDADVALSPDGRALAIVATDESGTDRIWIRLLGNPEWQKMAGTEGASYPFWSPDGRELAFFADGKLKKMDVASGAIQSLCAAPEARGGTWGTQGEILFAPEPMGPLQLVSDAGGKPTNVTHAGDDSNVTHRLPHFLPDGVHALFLSEKVAKLDDSTNGVYLLDLKKKTQVQVLPGRWEARYVAPGYLVYPKDGNLAAQPFNPASGKLSGSPAVIAENIFLVTDRFTGSFSLSQSGVLIALTGVGYNESQLTWFDLGGKQLGTLGPPQMVTQPPMIAADGRHVLVTAWQASNRAIVSWWYDTERGIATKLRIPDNSSPLVSPDGKTVLYGDESGTINTLSLQGGTPPVTVYDGNPYGYLMTIAPDGKSALYCTLTPGGLEFHRLSLEGSYASRPIAKVRGSNCVATFSPDGLWLAYESDETGQTEVYVAPVNNANARRQLSASGGFFPVWRGNEICYANRQRKLLAVEVKEAGNGIEMGRPREILGGAPLMATLLQRNIVGTGAYMTQDGKRMLLAIPRENSAPPLTLVTNWTQELKK
jgi:eukaryotic-like serine/threonine-protein kinase